MVRRNETRLKLVCHRRQLVGGRVNWACVVFEMRAWEALRLQLHDQNNNTKPNRSLAIKGIRVSCRIVPRTTHSMQRTNHTHTRSHSINSISSSCARALYVETELNITEADSCSGASSRDAEKIKNSYSIKSVPLRCISDRR